ncbi:hypothetical protein SynWH8103_00481 [Synechococcus sp. WH 8103]|nr:hypothetical protein SynWH8103_00481 [Synechococcus sp. WH 8103]
MMAFSEGLHPQGQPPQPLLPGFPMVGGEKDIIESDRTLREEFQSQGAVRFARLTRPAAPSPAVAGLDASAQIVWIDGEVPWVSFTQATLQKHACEAPEALQASCCLQLGPHAVMATGDAGFQGV